MKIVYGFVILILLYVFLVSKRKESFTGYRLYEDPENLQKHYVYIHIIANTKEDPEYKFLTLNSYFFPNGTQRLDFNELKPGLKNFYRFRLEETDGGYYLKTNNDLYIDVKNIIEETNSKNEKIFSKTKPDDVLTFEKVANTSRGPRYQMKNHQVFLEKSKEKYR